jgi:CAAX prenyl protease-like protein
VSPTPYLAPMVTFLALTALEGALPRVEDHPHPVWYPVVYAIKIAIVSGVAWACRSSWRDLKPRPRPIGWAVAVALGLVVLGLWIGLAGLYPALSLSGSARMAFDPMVLPQPGRLAFLIVRFYGLVLVVPLIEELFWRSFLIRFIIDPDFDKVPIGRVTPASAGVVSVVFALAHPEWLPALLTGLLWAWLLGWTKSVAACFVSHATANLGLGIYVLMTHHWIYW